MEKSVESIALLVYLIGCLVSLIIFVVRYARSSAVLGETMYFPILVLTSWFYVIILLCHGRRY